MIPAVSVLTELHRRRIAAAAEAAYPQECCGILYGFDRVVDGRPERVVSEVQAVGNDFAEAEKSHRFSIPPIELLRAFQSCGDQRDVLGFYHSHPDHPARPSEYDRAHAWGFYSYLIVSVKDGVAGDMTSWVLDERAAIFEPQLIRIV